MFIKDTDGTAEIVANNYYGADFKVSIFNQDDGTYVVQNSSTSELIEPVDSFSQSTVNNQVLGDTEIELDSVTGLVKSDRIQIQGYIYRVEQIIGSVVTIHKGLYENVTAGSTVTRVGNLGIYKTTINISNTGEYTLIGSSNIFGLKVTKMIQVQEKSLDTMYKDIKNLEYAILGS